MKIAVPISNIEEVRPLIDAGADEIYFGMMPQYWAEHFGTNSLNRRTSGNLKNLEELRYVVETTHSLKRQTSLTLNAQNYSAEQMQYLFGFAEQFANLGGDAFIVSDTGLLATLAKKNFGPRIHISSIATCRNSQASLFYKELGASRIIFPRYITLDEVKIMVSNFPTIEFETFILNDGCLYEEGMCQTIHLPDHLGGPICLDNYKIYYKRVDEKDISKEEWGFINRNEEEYAKWSWFKFSCGFSVTEEGYPHGPCGICAMPFFQKCGVTTVKIAGREFPLERKLISLKMVKSVLDKMDFGLSEHEVLAFGQGIRKKQDYCESGYMCYYPDILD